MTDLIRLTIAEARDEMKKGAFSSIELTDAYLAAIEAANPALNAYVKVTADKARDMAKASDARRAGGTAGALEGIPLGVKDLYATEGVHTQACSHVLDGFEPRYESTVTANLWADGAVMLGKLNMDEFAMGSSNETSYYGPVINPWRAEGSNARTWCPAALRAVRRLPLPRICAPAPPRRTPAARSASPRRSPARSASSRPMAAARAGALPPSPRRSTRRARSPAMCAMRPSC
jgi:Asp-tRNA(Asn)/Glu-tRNA(Gln) amidotransferase A subunit family amidase